MLPGPIHEFTTATEFRTGLLIGLVLAALGFVFRDRQPRTVPMLGLLITLGFAVGIASSSNLPANMALGATFLGIGGWVANRWGRSLITSVLLAVPGAVLLLTDLGSHRSRWVVPLAFVTVVIASPLVADFDRRFGDAGWPVVLYAVSVVGVYYTVPDTERVLVLLGVTAPLVLLGWPRVFASLGHGGSYAVTGILIWVAAFESRGADTALIGAIGCLGLLVFEPAARLFMRGRDTILAASSSRAWALLGAVTLQLLLAFVASRIAGARATLSQAIFVIVFESVAVTAALCTGYVRTG